MAFGSLGLEEVQQEARLKQEAAAEASKAKAPKKKGWGRA